MRLLQALRHQQLVCPVLNDLDRHLPMLARLERCAYRPGHVIPDALVVDALKRLLDAFPGARAPEERLADEKA